MEEEDLMKEMPETMLFRELTVGIASGSHRHAVVKKGRAGFASQRTTSAAISVQSTGIRCLVDDAPAATVVIESRRLQINACSFRNIPLRIAAGQLALVDSATADVESIGSRFALR